MGLSCRAGLIPRALFLPSPHCKKIKNKQNPQSRVLRRSGASPSSAPPIVAAVSIDAVISCLRIKLLHTSHLRIKPPSLDRGDEASGDCAPMFVASGQGREGCDIAEKGRRRMEWHRKERSDDVSTTQCGGRGAAAWVDEPTRQGQAAARLRVRGMTV
jgi:hypothetical protein